MNDTRQRANAPPPPSPRFLGGDFQIKSPQSNSRTVPSFPCTKKCRFVLHRGREVEASGHSFFGVVLRFIRPRGRWAG